MGKKDIGILALAVCAALVLTLSQFFGQTLEVGSWGLSFSQEGQTPKGPATADELRSYDGVYAGDDGEKVIYLTFDAGYENGCTEEILDVLEDHNVKAAFFLVGSYIKRNADLVRDMVEEGHIVGNHTMNHPDMSKISDLDSFQAELTAVENIFKDVTGKELPKFYRPPQGLYSEENLKMAQELGYHTVFWSLAYADWDNNNQPTKAFALEKLLSRTHDGAVVLLHSTSQTNGQILDELLQRWKDMGYRFETLDELYKS